MPLFSPSKSAYSSLLKLKLLFGLAIAILPVLIYYPGLHGPFIFDDNPNIVYNNNIKIYELSLTKLNEAAHSLDSGAFGRPLAGISFAINYYLAGGIATTFWYKTFNLIIHVINGYLVFWLVYLVITLLPIYQTLRSNDSRYKERVLVAGASALLWVIHPIQLTSVLYVVQRMTSMSALFIMLSIISYIYARSAQLKGFIYKSLGYFLICILTGFVSALCKETALLIPLYIGLVEFSLFNAHPPWSLWQYLSVFRQRALLACFITAIFILITIAIELSLPGYVYRSFTLPERLLTESRIVLFYLAQILVPQLPSFGIYHDYITVSTSLLSPWTTLVSIFLIVGMIIYAFYHRIKYPILAFGIFWFFASHSLESTFYPLELAHEHRNYLATIGPLVVIVAGIIHLSYKFQNNKVAILFLLFAIGYGATSSLRATQWDSLQRLVETETYNHPNSASAWADLFSIQAGLNMPDKAIASIQKAIQLRPKEPGYYLLLHLYTKAFNTNLALQANNQLMMHIADKPDSLILINTLQKISDCLDTTCSDLQHDFGKWVSEAIKNKPLPRYQYYLGHYFITQGNYETALKLLDESIKGGKERHASPIIKRIQVLLALKRYDDAKAAFARLEQLNKKYLYVRSSDILDLRQTISKKQQGQLP